MSNDLQQREDRTPDWMGGRFSDQINELTYRIDVAFGGAFPKIVQFVSARRGEGVSSVAAAYASAVSDILKRRVLVLGFDIDGGAGTEIWRRPETAGSGAMLDTLLDGRPMDEALVHINDRLTVARFASPQVNMSEVLFTMSSGDFWNELKDMFDEIVLDSPAVAASRLGLLLSSYADGTAVVVEAERTRAPVIDAMMKNLTDMGANILGAVFNRQKYYVPNWLYRRL